MWCYNVRFIQKGYIKDAINLFVQMQAANFEHRVEILRSILDFVKLSLNNWGLNTWNFNILNGR